jgi:transcriptional regulator CtsR
VPCVVRRRRLINRAIPLRRSVINLRYLSRVYYYVDPCGGGGSGVHIARIAYAKDHTRSVTRIMDANNTHEAYKTLYVNAAQS